MCWRSSASPTDMPAKKTVSKKSATKPAKKTAKKSSPSNIAPLTASLKIERMPLSAMHPHPRNPRKHPEVDSPEWKVLEASLAHDYFDPIVWNTRNGMLVSGHLRCKVLTSMGYQSADVVVVDYDEPTHIARLMAANKAIGENDLPKMKELFGELKTVEGFDMAVAGFTLPEVDDLFVADDSSAELPTTADSPKGNHSEKDAARTAKIMSQVKAPTSTPVHGERWILGQHVLHICSSVKGPFAWASELADLAATQGPPVLFVLCPDPVVALTDKKVRLFMIQPDPFVAGHIIDNFKKTHPAAACKRKPL